MKIRFICMAESLLMRLTEGALLLSKVAVLLKCDQERQSISDLLP